MNKNGIDISRYQGRPDFSKVKSKVNFVIMQAGYGKYPSQKDSSFESNYSGCKKHGIPCGVYWYSYAKNETDAAAEAAACIEVIKGKTFEYPVYIDMEEGLSSLGRAGVSSIADVFCSRLEKAGYFAGIYMSRSPAQSYLTPEITKKYALWLAEYGSRLNWSGMVGIWQNSSTGIVSGILGNVDTDICYVDYPGLIKEGGYNGFKKPEPAPSGKTLDKTGYKKGDRGEGVLAYKALLKIADKLGIIGAKLDDTSGFGGGTENATNALLKAWGYKPNGTAGEKLIKKLTEKILKQIGE